MAKDKEKKVEMVLIMNRGANKIMCESGIIKPVCTKEVSVDEAERLLKMYPDTVIKAAEYAPTGKCNKCSSLREEIKTLKAELEELRVVSDNKASVKK